jgi:gliding motility-associated-like protein
MKMTTKGLFVLTFFPLFLFCQQVYAQCDCDHIISLNATEYTFDGAKKGVKPGDKICFTSGTRTGIGFINVNGTKEKPVIITNMCDGKVILNAPLNWGNAVEFNYSSYFRFTGSGNPNEEYGVEIKGGQMGLNLHGLSSDFEIDHLNVNNVGCVGIVAKTDPTCDQKTWRGNFLLKDSKFHHNKISDTGCEGFYIGNSHYDTGVSKTCNSVTVKVNEHDVTNIEVYNNDLRNIGNDGIQVGAAKNATIHDNYVYNSGTKNNAQHQNLIQAGNGTQATVYNNIVDTGKGYGIFDAGGGGKYFNNIIINAQQGGMLLQDVAPNFAPTGFIVLNNTFINCKDFGVLMFSENLNPTYYQNNIIVGQNQSTYTYVNFNNQSKNKWVESNNIRSQDISTVKFVNASAKDFHLQSSSPAVNAGKDVSSYGVTQDYDKKARPDGPAFDVGAFEYQGNKPTSSAGPDRSITLPTNTIILDGSGSSPTGSISSYAWTKKSGGAATLSNETTPDLSVAGLAEGVYVFQLQVADVNGSATDEATVTVLPQAVNKSPVVNAGVDKALVLPANSLNITGLASDPDGTVVKYTWTQVLGPATALGNANTATLSLSNLIEGIFHFQLTVEDDKGSSSSDVVRVTVSPAATNIKPEVSTGLDKVVFLPTNSTVLQGTASDADGSIASILWEKKSGPTATLTNANTLSLTASNLQQGSYVFRLTVTDNSGADAFDEVALSVLVGNQNPDANAGTDKQITLPTNLIVINGSGSDADGSIASFAWAQVSGPSTASLTNQNKAQVTVANLVTGVYVVGLTVTDDKGATDYDEVTVTVNSAPGNKAPTASAGQDKLIQLPTTTVVVNGSGSDTDGTIASYLWTKKSGPAATLVNANTKDLTVNNLVAGAFVFTLRVTDNLIAYHEDEVTVTVLPATINQSPIANAGGSKYLTLPTNSTTLNGVGVDTDGTIATYQWSKEKGPLATLSGESTNTLSISSLSVGEYQFKLTVIDDKGASSSDFATVIVSSNNLSPVVNAGSNKVLVLPNNSISLIGSASDVDGSIVSYLWAQVSGPSATLSGTNTSTLSAANLTQGSYVFTLTVEDDDAETATAEVSVLVLPASSNLPPEVNAGTDQIIFLPTNSIVLEGSAIDTDGSITSYVWTQRSGSSVTLINENTQNLIVTGLTEGQFSFRLSVTDNTGVTVSDDIAVTVKPASQNQPPVVSTDLNQSIQLPTASITLHGSASDNDGSIVSYLWSKVSGPSADMQNASTTSLTVNNLVEGSYTFRLTAADNQGASAFTDVRVIVFPATINQSPIVDAGRNQILILPVNNTNLVGSGYDPDGTIAAYSWSQISGPTNSSITTTSSPITGVAGFTEGTYMFRLTVSDNSGNTSVDDILVIVNTTNTNSPPLADAGGNQALKLPTNSINLFGSGIDFDGTVTSYQWTKTGGGAATLANQGTPTLTVSALSEGLYTFRLRVTDDKGASNDDFILLVVSPSNINQAPVANAGPDKTIILPASSILVNGNGSDGDGQVTAFTWSKTIGGSATLSNSTTKDLLVTELGEGEYVLRLNVEDNSGYEDFDEMTVRVLPLNSNNPPVVALGENITIYLPNSSHTFQPSVTDVDGSISKFFWTKVSGPSVTLVDPEAEKLEVQNLVEGVYNFRLTAIDDKNTSASAEIVVTVLPSTVNQPPIVSAGNNQQFALPQNSLIIKGTASDVDGVIQNVLWMQVSGSPATLTNETSLELTVTNLSEGSYIFRLTATDNVGASGSSQVTVVVNPVPPNQEPIVSAGTNTTIPLPVTSFDMTGSALDIDGTIASVEWSQIQGPSNAILQNKNSLATTVSDVVAGTYVFRLTAIDNEGAKGFADIIVFIDDLSNSANKPPVVYAGDDIVLISPENELTIVGNALDPEGFIDSYAWTQISGPPADLIVNEHTLFVSDLSLGTYGFRLTATDRDSLSGFDDVLIAVIEKNNEVPKFFSPNQDGIGDNWVFRNSDFYQDCNIAVYNRAGKEVFGERPYLNNWNGVGKNGVPVDDGDYYYILTWPDGRELKGALRIIR